MISSQMKTLVDHHKQYVGIPQGGAIDERINKIMGIHAPVQRELPSNVANKS